MTVQESIAAALADHREAAAGIREAWCRCGDRSVDQTARRLHQAAVAMDAARQAVEALDTYGLADLGRSFGHGWNSCHAAVLDLLTPKAGDHD